MAIDEIKIWNVMYEYVMYIDPDIHWCQTLKIVNVEKMNATLIVTLGEDWKDF